MRIKLQFLVLLILLVIIEISLCKSANKTKSASHKRHNFKTKAHTNRNKRSPDEDEIPFWPHRGKRLFTSSENYLKFNSDEKVPNNEQDSPFWGARGRRDSFSIENDVDNNNPLMTTDSKYFGTNCKHCYKSTARDDHADHAYFKERREGGNYPFWGSRGRRSSNEDDQDNSVLSEPFWANRGRRQEDDPFWGSRGRRQESDPFWGSRGRRQSWSEDNVEEPPFWGNRGRRDDSEPFWGSRGRREFSDDHNSEDSEPFWGNRGRRLTKNSRRENLKEILINAINTVEDNIENLARDRRDSVRSRSFWNNRGRDSQLKFLFKNGGRHRYQPGISGKSNSIHSKQAESSTVLNDRIFAEQPHYIIVERSSRSSGEDDPFFISRGKKKNFNYEYSKAARDRRGAIEELVKSVRNDPYYIARGKKDIQTKVSNSSIQLKEIGKAKELICATIDLILTKNTGHRVKREENESERDRRTILKKIAAQLQMDPYFVSRGKKNESDVSDDNIEEFINEVSTKCN